MSEDGSVDLVEMRNDVTRVRIHKQDQSGNAIKRSDPADSGSKKGNCYIGI